MNRPLQLPAPLRRILPRRLAAGPMAATLALAWGFAIPPASTAAAPAQVECASVFSAILRRNVNYCVALPADYDPAATNRYPTLYFLHGLFENQMSWSQRGGERILNDLLAKEEIGPFFVALPDGGRSFYVNSLDGRERYEDFFIQEFVPGIDQRYRTIPKPSARGISGSSMGGYGALHLAMRHPGVFGSASAHGAMLVANLPDSASNQGRWAFHTRVLEQTFGSPPNERYWEASNPLTLARQPERFAGLKLYFDCGENDRYGFEEGAQLLDRILSQEGFPHEFVLRPGGHGWAYLNQYLKHSLIFHWKCFQGAEREWAARDKRGPK